MSADKLKHSEIKTENESDKLIVERVFSHKQEHVFRWWNDLTMNEQKTLLNQLRLIDFTLLQNLRSSVSHYLFFALFAASCPPVC